MRWLPWRRKQARPETSDRSGAVAVAERPSRDVASSSASAEPRGAVLTFARDVLALSGSQVRVEDPDLLAVVLPDGSPARYTGSLARVRNEADATLLVQGGAALGGLLDEVALRGSRVAFSLLAGGDPLALATAAISQPPAPDCGHCSSGADTGIAALCAPCPLRVGRLALTGVGRLTGARELRRHEALAVELTYRVTYRDRDGRRDESHRLAYDAATGEPVAPLALDDLAAGVPCSLPESLDLAPIAQRARTDLARTLEAGAALLALRADGEYQRRLHDLGLTHARLLRESPDTRAELEAGLAAERARLADLFAVGVEAELASVACITSTLAEVAVRYSGGELALAVDLGRGMVVPPRCAACGRQAPAASLCAQGHLVCPACVGASAPDGACPLCAPASAAAVTVSRARGKRGSETDDQTGALESLTVERLADLSERLWRSFVEWYLAEGGYVAEPPGGRPGLPVWQFRADSGDGATGAAGCAVAMRPQGGRRLGAADVRAAREACRGVSLAQLILVTPAAAEANARKEAAAASVQLVEHDALRAFLERIAAAHATALLAAENEAEARAQAAIETQRAMLGALTAVEKEIANCVNTRRATGRGPLATASNTNVAALREAERAVLAWETLVTDWLASFDDRPAPDGSLRILCAPDELRAFAERAEHLRAAIGRPLAVLAGTPGAGESGYTTWRRALLDQLTAACEALCWRISVVNLERWRDATVARDANAVAHAETAAQARKHTALRAAKARDQLAARIGL